MTVEKAIKKLKIARFAFKPESEAFASINVAIRSLEAWEKIRKEIEDMPSELTDDYRRMIRRCNVLEIIDKHLKGVTRNDNPRGN